MEIAHAPRAFIIFQVKGLPYACDLEHAKEVLSARGIYPLPNARKEVVGIKNLRGEVIPVFDLEEILFGEGTGADGSKKVLIVRREEDEFGLTVDRIDRIENFNIEKHSLSELGEGAAPSLFTVSALMVEHDVPIPILEIDLLASHLEDAIEAATASPPESIEEN